jgi:class 3 adenylate cyclase
MPSLHFTRAPIPIGIGALPAVWALNIVANPTWYTNGAFVVASLFVVALAISIHMVGTGAILRPVIAEIDHMYPHSVADARLATNSLRPRIVGSSVLVVWISAWLASGLVTRTAEPLPRLALTFAAGGVVALTFGSILMLALSQSIFAPLRALTNATRRVRAGDLATRLSLVSNDELGELARSFNAMVNGLAEREALRSALGTYVEPGIAERLLSEGEILQGEEVDVTIMFVDIVGFSARAEMMPADQICAELNDFFGLIVPIVAEHDGHTNKLIGDGLMAVFGTPIHLDDHADRALRSACAIQDALWERYRGALRAGIGLNTGSVVVGTMGGGTKLDFTLIGDAVNVAARVEALTRGTDDAILLTEATRQAVREPRVALASRGVTPVKGRAEPVSVYSARSWVPA